jgi:hypothetical protein
MAHEPSREGWTSRNATKDGRARRKANIENTALGVQNKGKGRAISPNGKGRAPTLKGMPGHKSPGSSSSKSDKSQLVDLVFEDEVTEETGRILVRGDDEPNNSVAVVDPKGDESMVREHAETESPGAEETKQWKEARDSEALLKPKYGVEGGAFENVWNSSGPSEPPRENP